MKRSNFVQIEDAISKMQDLLGQDSVQSQSGGAQQQQLEASNIEGYLQLLNDKYCNIMDILNQEDSLLNQVQKDNLKLKATLAEEIRNHENTINDSRRELQELREKNKLMLDQKSSQKMEKQFKEIQLNRIKSQIEGYEQDINTLMKQSVVNKQTLSDLQQQNQQLVQQYEELQQQHQSVQADFQQTMDQLTSLEDRIQQNKKILHQFQVKNKELEVKMNVVYEEQVNYEENTSKINKDQQTAALKNSQKLKKLQDLEKLKEKLQVEIELKGQQLTTLRQQNQEIQQKVDQLENTANQLQQEQQINIELKIENELLNWQISEINQKNFQNGHANAVNRLDFNSEQKFQPGAFSLKNVGVEKQDEYLNRILLNKDIGNRETYQMTEDIEKIKEEQITQQEEIQQLEKIIYEKDETLQSQQDTLQHLYNQQNALQNQISDKQTQKENAIYKYNSMKREMELMEQRYQQLVSQIRHMGTGTSTLGSSSLSLQQKSLNKQQSQQGRKSPQKQFVQDQQLEEEEIAEEEVRQASIKAEISPEKFIEREQETQQFQIQKNTQNQPPQDFDYNLVQIPTYQQEKQQLEENPLEDDDDILHKSPIKLDVNELRQIKASNSKQFQYEQQQQQYQ